MALTSIGVTLIGILVAHWIWHKSLSFTNFARLLGSIAAVVAPMLLGLWELKPPLSRYARRLVDGSQAQWSQRLRQALGEDGEPRAHVSFAFPKSGQLAPDIDSQLSRELTQANQALSGAQRDICQVYRDLLASSEGRLVVLGDPGSGKTVLLNLLIKGLADDVSKDDDGDNWLAPVLFNLSSCDLGDDALRVNELILADRFANWMVGQLIATHQVTRRNADQLVKSGRILPVLDGLDEVDQLDEVDPDSSAAARPRAAAIVRALNVRLGKRAPLILTCRGKEYTVIVRTDGSRPEPRLIRGDHVMMQPMATWEAADYLTKRFFDSRREGVEERWLPIVTALEKAQPKVAPNSVAVTAPVVGLLVNPWWLYLLALVFQWPNRRPASVLTMTAEQVEDCLLTGLIEHLASTDGRAAEAGWSAESIQQWLRTIVAQQRDRSTPANPCRRVIVVSELGLRPGRRWPEWIARLIMIVPSVGAAIVAALTLHHHLATRRIGSVALMVALAILVLLSLTLSEAAARKSRLRRIDVSAWRTRAGHRKLGRRRPLGLPFGLVRPVTSQLRAVRHPSQVIHQSLGYAVTVALVCGLLVGLIVWLIAGSALNLMAGLALGLAAGLGFAGSIGLALSRVWISYAVSSLTASRNDLLPRRPVEFLDWCVDVELMRMAGPDVQFRSAALQSWLARRA